MSEIIPANLVHEMKQSYGDYALAVIVGRAIPDLYDGLKPVTRRVLAAMNRLGLKPSARYMKCARVEGETMGRYHPHSGAYGALITSAQWWTNNSPLVDVHGNSGSPTDGPAAPRYTECKLTAYSQEVLLEDQHVWETRDNYDGSLQEPVRLNARIPNVLVNGAEGIGVGYATKIPTHNLRGIAKALRCMQQGDVKGMAKNLIPDFPTGCEIVKDEGMLEYVKTGRGTMRLRATCAAEEIVVGKRSKRTALVFTNLPIHINTEQVGEQIKSAIEKGQVTEVADVRDETDMSGIRLVVVLKASADAKLAELQLFKYTNLESRFSANCLVIDGVKPVEASPIAILDKWFDWRDSVFVSSLKAEHADKKARIEIVKGLILALDMIEDIIWDIRSSKDRATAKVKLVNKEFTPKQADAILDMRLSALTKLDDKTLRTEAKDLQARIKEIVKLTTSRDDREELLLDEVDEIAKRHGNARRSKVIDAPEELKVTVVKQGRTAKAVKKPRFVSVDVKKGIITQQRKLVRGATVVETADRMIFVCDNGHAFKTTATFKGPLASEPTAILERALASSLPEKPLIVVMRVGDNITANAISWEDFARTTKNGKRFIPDGAELLKVGPKLVLKAKGRKKDKPLGPDTVKARRMGGPGSVMMKFADFDGIA